MPPLLTDPRVHAATANVPNLGPCCCGTQESMPPLLNVLNGSLLLWSCPSLVVEQATGPAAVVPDFQMNCLTALSVASAHPSCHTTMLASVCFAARRAIAAVHRHASRAFFLV